MSRELVDRDERTLSVENAGYRWSYFVLTYGILVIVAYRAFVHNESSWDLMGLVVLGGVFNVAYRSFGRVLRRRWFAMAGVAIVTAGVLAWVLILLRTG